MPYLVNSSLGMSTHTAAYNDHEAFAARLRYCSDKIGSANALSKSAGIPQSTLHNYFGNGEPNRHNLIAIARAAQVSLEWLTAGIGDNPNLGDISIALGIEEETAFQKRFDEVIAKRGGMEALAKAATIPLDRLAQVKSGGQLTRGELLRLAQFGNVQLHWLIAGPSKAKEEPQISEVAAGLVMAEPDFARPRPRWISAQGESFLAETPAEAAERSEVLNAIFGVLPKGPVDCFVVEDDSMKGDFQPGDLLIIDKNLPLAVQAVYLFENLSTKRRFVARAEFKDEGIFCGYTNEYYDRNARFKFSPDEQRCLGRVIQRITPFP